MTVKQLAFRDYLLKRLGFDENDFREKYLDFLSQIAYIHKGIAAIEEVEWERNSKPYYNFDGERYIPQHFNIIDLLIWEYKLKKDKSFKTINYTSKYISATDLANFTYCPIGFSIGKTYDTPKNIFAETGTKKHEEHKLLNLFQKKDKNENLDENEKNRFYNRYTDSETIAFFDDLKRSELIYSGHTKNENKYFINEEINFIGQPDYIFKNSKGKYFVVEEKFKKDKNSNNKFFLTITKFNLQHTSIF